MESHELISSQRTGRAARRRCGRRRSIVERRPDRRDRRHDRSCRPASPIDDAGELVVLPGLVDTHVHINEPGRTDWEGFETATRAAAAGGVTTLVDMPLNSIPATTTSPALEAKRPRRAAAVHVDVGFWGGVVPGNAAALEPLARAGVRGFKCFLVRPASTNSSTSPKPICGRRMPILAALGLPLLVHAEWPAQLLEPDERSRDPRSYATWLRQPSAGQRSRRRSTC